MKQKLILVTVSTVIVLLLLGIAKLYISYNLSYYAGYYVQQLPRKEGTNPELVILLENVDYVSSIEIDGITYDTDGNGSINKIGEYHLIYTTTSFDLWLDSSHKYFEFNKSGEFIRYFEGYPDEVFTDDSYKAEAQAYLDEILPPILKAQKQPDINLQWLFNQKYEKRFN
ncbi:hypothetical protein [Streptococcus fryi]